jgi:hypothetical protein
MPEFGILRLMAFICDESAARRHPGMLFVADFSPWGHYAHLPLLHILHKEVRF